jgi:hypothetical protein
MEYFTFSTSDCLRFQFHSKKKILFPANGELMRGNERDEHHQLMYTSINSHIEKCQEDSLPSSMSIFSGIKNADEQAKITRTSLRRIHFKNFLNRTEKHSFILNTILILSSMFPFVVIQI